MENAEDKKIKQEDFFTMESLYDDADCNLSFVGILAEKPTFKFTDKHTGKYMLFTYGEGSAGIWIASNGVVKEIGGNVPFPLPGSYKIE